MGREEEQGTGVRLPSEEGVVGRNRATAVHVACLSSQSLQPKGL